jgi:hypothetical protein
MGTLALALMLALALLVEARLSVARTSVALHHATVHVSLNRWGMPAAPFRISTRLTFPRLAPDGHYYPSSVDPITGVIIQASWFVRVPIWIPLALCGSAWLILSKLARDRTPQGRCLWCGYDYTIFRRRPPVRSAGEDRPGSASSRSIFSLEGILRRA